MHLFRSDIGPYSRPKRLGIVSISEIQPNLTLASEHLLLPGSIMCRPKYSREIFYLPLLISVMILTGKMLAFEKRNPEALMKTN
jgi:hypothetical protein